jgi:hypothetical protein
VNAIDRLAPLSGLAFVVLFGVGSGIWGFDQPDRDAGTKELLAFYDDSSTEILIGGTLSLSSIPFLVWFGAVVRDRLAAAEEPARSALPSVAFAGALVLAAVGLGAETINMAGALSAEDGQLTADTAQVYFDVSWALGAPAAGVGLAMLIAPVAVVALGTGSVLPSRATAWATLLVALVFLTPIMLTPAYQAPYAVVLMLMALFSVSLYRGLPSS